MVETDWPADDVPFGGVETIGNFSPFLGGRMGTPETAEALKAMRERIESWARGRGFVMKDSRILTTVQSVDVEVPLYAVTAWTADVFGAALARLDGTLVSSPA